MSPKISIIIPSYNEEKNISRCLDSVMNQTFSDFEVLCVDDGSNDKTYDIIKKYSEKDSRIIPMKNPNKGVSSARNFGIENANGDYIGFVDSDDFIQPQMYEFLYKAVTENNCDFSVCRYKKTSEFIQKKFEYKTDTFKPENFISFYDSEFTNNNELVFSSACTKLISKKFLNDIKFKNYKIGEDTVFNSEIYSKAEKQFLKDFKNSVFVFIEQNPLCTMDDVIERFSTPEEVVHDYISEALATENLCQKIQFRRFVKKILLILLIGLLAALAVRTIALLHIVNESEQYYITREVTEIE